MQKARKNTSGLLNLADIIYFFITLPAALAVYTLAVSKSGLIATISDKA
jgi:hypothetical protein